MKKSTFAFKDNEGMEIHTYKFVPDDESDVKAVVQISHGMAETAARYEKFAEDLTSDGFIVYANDHRGHGNTAKSMEDIGYIAEKDGFHWMVEDMHELSLLIKADYPSLSLFLFGHSMGSFLVQRYIQLYSNEIKGVILSGSNGKQGLMLNAGGFLARRECEKFGRRHISKNINNMTFGKYNNAFKPNRTEFDWLSRDNSEVDKYIADPYCGGVFTAGFFHDFFYGLKAIEKKSNIAKIKKELPIYIFSGSMDPVGGNGKGVIKLFNTYKKSLIKDISCKIYEGGRHEMLNELNRDEVIGDIIHWLDAHI